MREQMLSRWEVVLCVRGFEGTLELEHLNLNTLPLVYAV
jgi:hypothetical protein